MIVQFIEIPAEGLQVQLTDTSWFPLADIPVSGEVQGTLFLERDVGRVLAHGTIQYLQSLQCDRCLENFNQDRDVEFQVVLEYIPGVERPLEVSAEQEFDPTEEEVEYLSEPAIDVSNILRQQVFLSQPFKALCREDCLGLCLQCGKNKNFGDCGCDNAPSDSPFQDLGRLFKSK
ncbi:MAG: DUF177 domain-containing protein [Proteobacteria bacterium]|nr:DUF177 domain-containing protein [Pseudomonadota bacterium]MBU1688923.1 DUF177 domain-containing protein [Pseudomonadota bacterium]